VKVCHIPQGNSTNCKTICVSINAYQTLLNNGSYLGECLPLCALPTQSRSEVNISDYVIENKPFEVTFWPNPANNVFNITVDSESDELIQMMVLNINGQIIDKVSDVKAGSTITIGNDWKPGFYLLETTQGNQKKLIKLIKTQ
ncbi:MAG: T9SS type A sorting domain-containing protein, partial [Flavobacterium sp.]